MAIEKNWWQNVTAALDLLRESVGDATTVLQKAGGREMTQGNLILARKVLDYCDKIDGFMMSIENVGEQWDKIKSIIDGEAPGVKETVSQIKVPKESISKKTGYTRKVDKVAPWTNFTATMEDGEFISEPTAKEGFAKVFSHFNLEKCAALGIQLNGEPLLSKGKKTFKKYPAAVAPVKGGWFINTYCSTAMKVSIIKQCASVVGQKIEINVVPHELAGKSKTSIKQEASSKPKPPPAITALKFPYKVGQVAVALFPELMKNDLLSTQDMEFLLSIDSSREFRVGGNPVLKKYIGNDSDRYIVARSGKKYTRYYEFKRTGLVLNGEKYLLSNQFSPTAIRPVLEFAIQKGISTEQIIKLVQSDIAAQKAK